MPLIDKPLPELRKYRGISPCPRDFGRYWTESLKELDSIPPRPQLIPTREIKSMHADCFDLWFTGVGGAKIHAKYLRPKNARRASLPAVCVFHGYGWNSGEWFDKLAWVAEGFCVAALDCRGQGGSSEDRGGVKGPTKDGHIIRGLDDSDPKALLFRSIYLDTVQLARVILNLPEVNPARVGALGISQGGALTLACAALEPRICRAAAVSPFLSDFRRVWEMDLAKDAYQELNTFFRFFDPRHEREKEIFERLGYIDIQNLAPRIKAEVLLFTGLMDTVCPPSTQFAAYNKIPSSKEVVIYPDYAHENLPGQFDRIFEFMRGMPVARRK